MPDPQTSTTPATNDSTGQVSYAEFAAKIRAKYPKSTLYKTKPDKELVDAWIQAKPERSVYVKKIKGFDPLNENPKGEKVGGIPQSTVGNVSRKPTSTLVHADEIKKQNAIADHTGAALPAAGGMIGGLIGKTPGAALGGMLGAGAQDLMKRIVNGDDSASNKQLAMNMITEGVKQGLLEKGSQYVGKGLFYLLGKIPHAAIQQGVKFLPHELPGNKGSVVSKYIADLLTNLVPSAKTMAEDATTRNARVIGAANKLAKGFGRTQGTSEEIGLMVQDAIKQQKELAEKAIAAQGGMSPSVQKAFGTTALVKEYEDVFKNALAEHIVKEGKPEAIVGYIRGTAGLEDTRTVLGYLKDKGNAKVVNAVKSRLMADIVQETLTGTKDPILKQLQKQDTKFVGQNFKSVLDKVGEEKLKAIYGMEGYENITEFAKLVEHIGTNGTNGAGKFLNLIFVLGPLRTGLTFAAGKKLVTEGFIFNRMAKYMVSTEGIKLTENYARAISIGAKVPNALYDQMKAFNERQDREYVEEQKAVEEQYYKDHPDEVKYRQQNKTQEK
jgi:hypothetical protein